MTSRWPRALAASARIFLPVHRRVAARHQARRGVVRFELDDACAEVEGADRPARIVNGAEGAQASDDRFRLRLHGRRQQQSELVTAEAKPGVDAGPDRRPDARRQLAQDLIAGAVAETVVDALELVDVEIDDAERLARAARARALGRERGLEAAPVEEAGEAVRARQRFERAAIATNAPDQRRDH